MNKQIEEMAKIINKPCFAIMEEAGATDRDCPFPYSCEECSATNLYNAGYRKQSEVAREIFAEIEEILKLKKKIEIERRDDYRKTDYPMFSYTAELGGRIYGYSVVEEQIAELKKKYGVTEDESES